MKFNILNLGIYSEIKVEISWNENPDFIDIIARVNGISTNLMEFDLSVSGTLDPFGTVPYT